MMSLPPPPYTTQKQELNNKFKFGILIISITSLKPKILKNKISSYFECQGPTVSLVKC